MINKVKTFFRLDLRTKILFLRTYILCGYYRFVMLFVPFNKLAKKMGELGVESSEAYNEELHPYILKVRKMVMTASKNTPWESLCMVQALTAQKLLNNKEIDSTIYFGLSKDENNEPIAHAWLKHGGKIVVGEKGVERFSVVARFGSVHI
ncbi:MAG: lasso peptide biosynthesis B2 protein [Clostridiales bacterium]|nr:lasso peptide biosynthesis B2 protein [Clostridiales bacterium]